MESQRTSKRWLTTFISLAVVVALGTVTALKMYGQALTHQVKVLNCGYEVHEHDEDYCYDEDGELICRYADYVVHVHNNEDCYDTDGNLVCELPEIEPHEHDDSCYEDVEVLICSEKESGDVAGHKHSEEAGCYTLVKGDLFCELEEHSHAEDEAGEPKLVCELEEHVHNDDCYSQPEESDEDGEESSGGEPELTCEVKEHSHTEDCYVVDVCELEEHVHNDDCYNWTKELTCQQEESESRTGHTHTDKCYKTETVLTCGLLEMHTHSDEEECFEYEYDEETGEVIAVYLVCDRIQLEEHVHGEGCFENVNLTPEEVAALNQGATLHVHSDECYDEEGNLICGHEVTHLHTLECYDDDGNLICGFGGGDETEAAHEHDANCYDEEGNLICGHEDAKVHEHDGDCYDEEGNLVCGHEGVKTHEHDANCYDEKGNLICGHENAKAHEHDAKCFDEEGSLICGYEGAKVHEHDENCYDIYGELICGYEGAEEHVHTEDCYDEEGNLICGYKVRTEYDNSRTFEGEDYIVVARFDDDAAIPQEAELLVEKVTPASDREHYERREAQYRELVGDEAASMRGLFKIGFYMEEDGEKKEIEPGTPVTVSVQFLDEDGLPEGRPVTVIHFAEEGTEKLDGGSAVDNSTTFRLGSFSEVAIGYVPEEEPRELTQAVDGTMRLHLADSFEYEDDAFHITFHVEGEAILPKDTAFRPSGSANQEDDAAASDGTAADTAEDTDTNINTDVNTDTDADTDKGTDGSADADADTDGTDEAADTGKEEDASADNADAENAGAEDQNATAEQEASEGGDASEAGTEPGREVSDNGSTAEVSADTENETVAVPRLRFKVEQVEKDSKEYQSFKEYAEKTDGAEELYRLQVMTYSLTYGGEELNLSRCKVTAEVRPSQTLEKQIEKSVEEAAAYLIDNDGAVVQNETEVTTDAVPYILEDENDGAADGTEGTDGANDQTDAGQEGETENDAVEAGGVDSNKEDASVSDDNTEQKNEADSLEAGTSQIDTAETDISQTDAQTERRLEQSDFQGTPYIDDLTKYYGNPSEIVPTGLVFTVSVLAADGPRDKGTAVYDGKNGSEAIQTTVSEEDYAESGTNEFDTEAPVANLFAARASGQPNPKFTVQFYANLDVLATKGTNALTMIDTSGGVLPKNKGNVSTEPTGKSKYMYVDDTGKVQTVKEVTEVYKSRDFEYYKAPTINYMNALVENTNYELKEVWVLKDGKTPTSTERNDWNTYDYNANLHFTNRAVSAESGQYILIEDNAVIRFVYDTTKKDKDFSAAFYDYDISNGFIYRTLPPADVSNYRHLNAGDVFAGDVFNTKYVVDNYGGTEGWGNGVIEWCKKNPDWDKHIYTYTKEQGINSSGNYSGTGTKLAFGNVNTGTGLGKLIWSKDNVNNELNKYNNQGYQGCTFGLVTGMSDDKIQYASGIQAPKLFNEDNATGKTSYSDYSLQFKRVGDTYTLSAVNGTVATDLGNFSNPTNSTGTHTSIWTNNFWPMDSAPSFGTGTHDVKFGHKDYFKGETHELRFGPITEKGSDYTFPESDDGLHHNSYFGMNYEVEFDLTKDYVGPLEYYFFGDDDMWVFLDGKLVCDIGGVHSSVGEYVNLWDYLHKHGAGCYNNDGEFICTDGITHEHNDNCYGKDSEGKKVLTCKQNTKKLSFFYTERGASGSTCWMQFTLPSVSSLTPEMTDEDYGHLRIEKTVTQVYNGHETIVNNNDEFTFKVHFTMNDENLPDDYSYVKYAHKKICYDNDGKVTYSHSEDCYKDGELACIHKKTEYDKDGKLIHGDSCYDEDGKLTCGHKTCYDKDGNLTCNHEGDDEIGSDLIIWDGGEFTLKNGEYIIVKYLPQGTHYKITETDQAVTVIDNTSKSSNVEYFTDINGSATDPTKGKIAEGNIPKANTETVNYNNKFYLYGLPKTGGPGTNLYTIAGALIILLSAGFLYKKKFRERRV